MAARIFLSYRRADSSKRSNDLYGHLRIRYGRDYVFQDIDDIKPGDDFLNEIKEKLKSCEVYLVIIGPHWLVDAKGKRRLNNPKDILRMEVTLALAGKGTVIPVLVGGSDMPPEDKLPDTLKALSRRQAVVLRDNQWTKDVEALIDRINELILPTLEDTPQSQAHQVAHEMQLRYFKLLESSSASEALDLTYKTHDYLDKVLPLYPHDSYLKVVRGYLYKNAAMALQALNRIKEANAALDEGEIIFRAMLEERPDDDGAWNGLGSVEAVRGNYEKAVEYIDRALELDPDNPIYQGDLDRINKHLGR